MIKQLKLHNFQSHKDAELNFRPGVNLIVGESDHGKTALLRGIRWLVFNRPSGFPFKSWWAAKGEDTSVSVVLSTNETATRRRNAKDNVYAVSNLTDELEAVRTDVPDEVKAVLQMDSLNVQRQGDKPFLLDESPAEVARVLNMVAGLESIDAAHTRVAGKIRENQAAQRTTDAQVSSVEIQLKVYNGLPELQAQVNAHCREQNALKAQQTKTQQLERLITTIETCTSRLRLTEGLAGAEREWKRLFDDAVAQSGKAITTHQLKQLTDNIERLCYRIAALPKEQLQEVEEALAAYGEMAVATAKQLQRTAVLGELGKAVKAGTDTVVGLTDQIDAVAATLETYNVCPQCGAEKKHWAKV